MLGRESVFNFTTEMTGKEGIRAVFPNSTTTFFYYSHNWSLLAGALHPYFTHRILFIWMHIDSTT